MQLKQKGYILLETLIGVGILSIVIVSVLGAVSQNILSVEEIKKQSIAVTLAQKKMEEIKSKVKINKKSVSKEDAKRLFKNSKYFLDALKDFKKENVEVYDLNGLYFLSPYAKSDYSKIFGSFEFS